MFWSRNPEIQSLGLNDIEKANHPNEKSFEVLHHDQYDIVINKSAESKPELNDAEIDQIEKILNSGLVQPKQILNQDGQFRFVYIKKRRHAGQHTVKKIKSIEPKKMEKRVEIQQTSKLCIQ